ncbi:MAG: gliding motility protein GldN [Saprospiraceae bacterium]|nr:MAG: gliding motility associated protein GldN [Bacteroidetes bacterium OLB9]MCO6463502.1 gliding motility protein GldN [Saprospiraceae bacterium]MCZ2339187.1 gliding motility protein GldN [Chitinophagales bacterium]
MKSFINFFALLFCSSMVITSSYAQNNQLIGEIKTESSVPTEESFVDDLVSKRLIVENRLLLQQPIREADIAWEKRVQRVVDTREKLNLPFVSEELNLFNTFKTMIMNGEISAFSDESFKNLLSPEDIEGKMIKMDTTMTLDPETYEEKILITRNDVNWRDIKQYRIKEIWYFDKQRSVMDVRIIGIAPIYQSHQDKEAGIPPAPMFWVYYPECRMPLSKHRVFNDENDMAPMTWADLFDQRVFSSYIYKRSNVLDYRLKDYYVPDPNAEEDRTGIDILLYSEKIKNELLNFEHDLWEY